jgi:hypothetical protein
VREERSWEKSESESESESSLLALARRVGGPVDEGFDIGMLDPLPFA